MSSALQTLSLPLYLATTLPIQLSAPLSEHPVHIRLACIFYAHECILFQNIFRRPAAGGWRLTVGCLAVVIQLSTFVAGVVVCQCRSDCLVWAVGVSRKREFN